MEENNISLSICIPTFNRAEYLRKTLNSLIQQEMFGERCEIVISDNCSTDETPYVIEEFRNKYKNIRYYRNESNVGVDRNILCSLNLGQGKYLKLNTDKTCFYQKKLDELVEYLGKADQDIIFLLNEETKFEKKGMIEINNFDEFVQLVSILTTWGSAIVFKNAAFKNLNNKERAIGSNLIQSDIMFRLIVGGGKTAIINKKFIFEQSVDSKGGYNFFKVFISNYLGLYEDYLKKGFLNPATYEKEKIKLLKNFIFSWYTTIVIRKDKNYCFDYKDCNRIILKHFGYKALLLSYPFHIIKRAIRRVMPFIQNIKTLKSEWSNHV